MEDEVIRYDIVIQNGLDTTALNAFFQAALKELKFEIEAAISRLFHKPENLFLAYTEMSWMNMLNNAIIRADGYESQTAMELSLYNDSRHKGRLDLLVSVELEGNRHLLLFEGKLSEFRGVKTWDLEGKHKADTLSEYARMDEQASRYAELISDYGAPITKVAIGFQWMRSKKAVESAYKYMKRIKEDKETQFCALYTIGEYGVWAYGKVYADSK